MAERLARMIGTEEDKVNCPFFYKIGACRHGDKCTRNHIRPEKSQTLLVPHMYNNPTSAIAMAEGARVPENVLLETIKHFEDFYEDVFIELSNYGEIEELNVCDNIGDHLIGNVYVKYTTEDDAENAYNNIQGRTYDNRRIVCEYSPVTDFKEARCRQYDEGECKRGGYCNFMHLKHVSRSFKKQLFKDMYEAFPEYRKRRRDREKNKDTDRGHRKSRSHSKGKTKKKKSRSPSKKKDKKKKKSRSRSRSSEKSGGRKEMTSEERRAMIAAWNDDENDQHDNPGQGSYGGMPAFEILNNADQNNNEETREQNQ